MGRRRLIVGFTLLAACDNPFLHPLPDVLPAPTELPACAGVEAPTLTAVVNPGATPTVSEVALSWALVDPSAVLAFAVERQVGGAAVEVCRVFANTFACADSAAPADTSCSYRVTVERSDCTISSEVVQVLTAPLPPTEVVTSLQVSPLSVTLNWTAQSDDHTRHVVARSGGAAGAVEFVVPAGTDAYSDTDVVIDAAYTYAVRAETDVVGAVLTSLGPHPEATQFTPPSTPADLATTTSQSSIGLQWTNVSQTATGLEVRRSADAGTSFVLLASPGPTVTAHEDDTVVAGTTYLYHVVAINPGGGSVAAEVTAAAAVSPILAWTAAPTLDAACGLHVSGSVVFDALVGTTYGGADGSVGSGEVPVASATGFDVTLAAPAAGPLEISWSVADDLGNIGSLVRTLQLDATPVYRSSAVLPGADDTQIGRQALFTASVDDSQCRACSGTRASLAAGFRHTCVIGTTAGTVTCWGSVNSYGCAPPTCSNTPSSTPLAGVVEVVSANSATCALVDDGTIRCFGDNACGALGRDTPAPSANCSSADRLSPTWDTVCADATCAAAFTGATSVAVGTDHVCALRNDATVWCWGWNHKGQLGNPTPAMAAEAHRYEPMPVCLSGAGVCTGTELQNVRAIAAGSVHTCAIVGAGEVRCWGGCDTGTSMGLRGSGCSTGSTAVPDSHVCTSGPPCSAAGTYIDDAVALALGDTISCALRSDSTVWCWGENLNGQLGTGSAGTDSLTAVQVCSGDGGSPCAAPLSGAIAIAAGDSHVCALLEDGRVKCWGANASRQLGNSSTADSAIPALVCTAGPGPGPECTATLANGVAIVAGENHTCVAAESGLISCWGGDAAGPIPGSCSGGSNGHHCPFPSTAFTGPVRTCNLFDVSIP